MGILNWIFPGDNRWLYHTTPNNNARFLLGKTLRNGWLPPPAGGMVANKSLICFGVNPSTAKPNDPDPTIRRVESFARTLGYDSWIMLNVYPQRALKPSALSNTMDPAYHAENFNVIRTVLNDVTGDLWAAWGVAIRIKSIPYLRNCLSDIAALAVIRQWYSMGVTKKGDPRHPSRLPCNSKLQPFNNMAAYVARICP